MSRLGNSVTLMIPTHGRHAFLRRALDYYHEFDGRIIVADSSAEPFPASSLPEGVTYFHFPETRYLEKMQDAVGSLATEYTLLAADDDFINLEAAERALEFLEDHPDYGVVQGWHTAFRLNKRGKVRYQRMIHAFAHDYHVDADDPCMRIQQQLCPYLNNFYGLQRTAIWKEFFLTFCPALAPAELLNHPLLFELTQAIYCVYRGKHRVLPVFWIAREHLTDSLANKSAPTIREMTESGELDAYKQSLAEGLMQSGGAETGTIRQALDKAFDDFIYQYSVQWESQELAHQAPIEEAMDSPRSREILKSMLSMVCEHQARPDNRTAGT